MLQNTTLERLVKDKHSSLLGLLKVAKNVNMAPDLSSDMTSQLKVAFSEAWKFVGESQLREDINLN